VKKFGNTELQLGKGVSRHVRQQHYRGNGNSGVNHTVNDKVMELHMDPDEGIVAKKQFRGK
jgi:hypothetical protein